MKVGRFICLIFLLFFLDSCQFEFSEDYYVDLASPEAEAIFTIDSFEEGELLYAPKTISYVFDGRGKHKLYNINVSVDNRGVFATGNETGSFEIDTDDISEGEHMLTIRYQFSSGTRSLADISESERFEGTLTYSFSVNKSEPEPVNLTKVEVVDGSIFLSWDQIASQNFDEAVIRVSLGGHYQTTLREFSLDKVELFSSSFKDSLTTELHVDYTVTLKNRYAESKSNVVNLELEKPEISGQIIDDQSYKIFWEEHPLYGNFDYFKYYNRRDGTESNEDLSNRGGEYIVHEKPVFADNGNVETLVLKRNQGLFNQDLWNTVDFGQGFEPIFFDNIFFDPNGSAYYVLDNGKLYWLHSTDLSITAERDFPIPNMEDIMYDPQSTNLIVSTLDNLVYLTSSGGGFTIVNSWDAADYYEGNQDDVLSVDYRNGIVLIEVLDELVFYNSETKEEIHSQIKGRDFLWSDDGRYFYNNGNVYVLTLETASLLIDVPDSPYTPTVKFVGEQMFYYDLKNEHLWVYDLDNLSSQILFDHSADYDNVYDVKIDFDYSSNKLFIHYAYHIVHQETFNTRTEVGAIAVIYDIITGENKQLRLKNTSHTFGAEYYFLGSNLLSSLGLYLDSDYLK